MGFLDVVSLVGAIVSIGAAIWAGMSVDIIKKTKDEIFSRLRIAKYSELDGFSKPAILQLRKIANKSKIPPGINFDSIVDDLNDYYEGLNSIRNETIEDGYSDMDEHMKQLRDGINSASKLSRRNKDIIQAFTDIYYHVLELDSNISGLKKKVVER